MGVWEELKHLIRHQDLSFGERHIMLFLYDFLRYDGRTREGKLARKMAQLRLMTASDDDLADLARYELRVCPGRWTYEEVLERLIKRREELQARAL